MDRSGVRNLFSTLYRALEVIIHGHFHGGCACGALRFLGAKLNKS